MATKPNPKTKPAATEAEADAAPENTIPALRVSAKVDGFRRAGRAWSTAETIVPASEFTYEQTMQLLGEPKLAVKVIDIPVAE